MHIQEVQRKFSSVGIARAFRKPAIRFLLSVISANTISANMRRYLYDEILTFEYKQYSLHVVYVFSYTVYDPVLLHQT